MITGKALKLAEQRLSAAGLTAKLVQSDEPELTDDQIEIFENGVDTRVYIQIALIGGGFYVNESRGNGTSLTITDRGSFRSLSKAVDCAIKTIKNKQTPEHRA